jgi:DNA-binding HxlR family transcriptional regulator
MNCSIAKALEEVGEWWTLLIVRELTQGAVRFDEICNGLGIARNVLTTRLARLVELGIVERFPLSERAHTDGYRLTEKGEELYPVLVTLMQWGDRWCAKDCKAPFSLVDDASGKAFGPLVLRNIDGKALSYKDVRIEPGPGATEITKQIIYERNRRVLG